MNQSLSDNLKQIQEYVSVLRALFESYFTTTNLQYGKINLS